ncbi:hypothetical protein LWI28_011241 [Acer negundo]|uniref:Uncharacterized protein n=1 Tax=Acer negundo TaxID=4023 RepID=A0AAD5P068_ACENE|nr:hypothetical protein LWI28_011241 [Acer negundo]
MYLCGKGLKVLITSYGSCCRSKAGLFLIAGSLDLWLRAGLFLEEFGKATASARNTDVAVAEARAILEGIQHAVDRGLVPLNVVNLCCRDSPTSDHCASLIRRSSSIIVARRRSSSPVVDRPCPSLRL